MMDRYTAFWVAALSAAAGGLYLTYIHDWDGTEADTNDEQKTYLQELADAAPSSIDRFNLLSAACGPLAEAIEAKASERGLDLSVTTEFEEIGTNCDVRIDDTFAATFDADDLEDDDKIERLIDRHIVAAAPETFCQYFNNTVIPTLEEIGVQSQITATYYDDNRCWIKGRTAEDTWPHFIVTFDKDNFDDKGNLTQYYQEYSAKRILDNIPVTDRRLIADQLPALLAGPAQP